MLDNELIRDIEILVDTLVSLKEDKSRKFLLLTFVD